MTWHNLVVYNIVACDSIQYQLLSYLISYRILCLRGTKGVPRKGVWTSVNVRVWACKELRVRHDQTSKYSRPPLFGTFLVPSRLLARAQSAFAQMGLCGKLPQAVPESCVLFVWIGCVFLISACVVFGCLIGLVVLLFYELCQKMPQTPASEEPPRPKAFV